MDKKRILIVDDDIHMRSAIRRMLSVGQHYEIKEVQDGLSVEKMVKQFMPHLVILDIKMPGMDGYEVCFHLRKDPDLKDLKIIAVSGLAGNIGDSIISALGADYYFSKPFDNDRFKEAVITLLNVKEDH